jgi:hypothetical protein
LHPQKIIMDLLKETCDPTLVAQIPDCDWETDMQTLTTPYEKKYNNALEDLENTTWYKNAFDLQQIGTKSSNKLQIKTLKLCLTLTQMQIALRPSTSVTSSHPPIIWAAQ